MAKKASRKRRPEAAADEPAKEGTPALDRIAALLGLYVVKDMDADEAAVKLGNRPLPREEEGRPQAAKEEGRLTWPRSTKT